MKIIKAFAGKNFDRRRISRFAFALALVLAATWAVSWAAARWLIIEKPLARSDAIVVLAGARAYIERTEVAARLFHEGRAPIIVLTNDKIKGGWSSREQRNLLFVERAVNELQQAGVPDERIKILTTPVGGTYDESQALREFADTENVRSLCVVTSAYHTRRALWIFEKSFAGTSVQIGVEAVPPGASMTSANWWASVEGWQDVAGEYVKIVYYRWQYE